MSRKTVGNALILVAFLVIAIIVAQAIGQDPLMSFANAITTNQERSLYCVLEDRLLPARSVSPSGLRIVYCLHSYRCPNGVDVCTETIGMHLSTAPSIIRILNQDYISTHIVLQDSDLLLRELLQAALQHEIRLRLYPENRGFHVYATPSSLPAIVDIIDEIIVDPAVVDQVRISLYDAREAVIDAYRIVRTTELRLESSVMPLVAPAPSVSQYHYSWSVSDQFERWQFGPQTEDEELEASTPYHYHD